MVESIQKRANLDLPEQLMLQLGVLDKFTKRPSETDEEFEERKSDGIWYQGERYDYHDFFLGEHIEAMRSAAGEGAVSGDGRDTILTEYKTGEEEYFCYGKPAFFKCNKESWEELFRICCEAGFIMEIPESERESRICLSILDSIMYEALLRTDEHAAYDYTVMASRGKIDELDEEVLEWAKSIDEDSEILIGGFYASNGLCYELISKYHDEDVPYSTIVRKVMKLFHHIGLDDLDQLEEAFKDPWKLLNFKEYDETSRSAWGSKKNERLLCRTSTLYKVNQIYKTAL